MAGEEGEFCQGVGYLIKFPVCEINSRMEPHYPIVSLLFLPRGCS